MTGRRSTPSLPADHAAHDRAVIAAAASRDPDLPTADASLAQTLLDTCPECARLHTDLQTLAAALPFAATPRRTRDFTLSAADAERLRPRGLTRWLRLIGSSRDTLTRPLAIGFTTLGLAGLLVATVPGALPSGGATVLSAVNDSVAPAEAAPEATPDTIRSAVPAAPAAPSAAPSVDDGGVFGGSDTGDPAATASHPATIDAPPADTVDEPPNHDDASGLPALLVVAGVMTMLGLGLFVLRWSTGRSGL